MASRRWRQCPRCSLRETIINLRERETELLKEESRASAAPIGGKHPLIVSIQEEKATLQRKIDAEVERIATTIANEGEVIASRIRALEGEMKDVSDGSSLDRGVAVKLRELERDADASRNLYNSFLERYKELAEQQRHHRGRRQGGLDGGRRRVRPARPGPSCSVR